MPCVMPPPQPPSFDNLVHSFSRPSEPWAAHLFCMGKRKASDRPDHAARKARNKNTRCKTIKLTLNQFLNSPALHPEDCDDLKAELDHIVLAVNHDRAEADYLANLHALRQCAEHPDDPQAARAAIGTLDQSFYQQ